MKVQDIFNNEALLAKLNAAETVEEIEKIIADNHVDMTLADEELREEELENVAGGYIVTTPFTNWLWKKLFPSASVHGSSNRKHGGAGKKF